ncbi:Hypothetical protein A7982_01500 [Minicystis rosea]|nr:Hypothetical protein A7982_01500 [Minicystis rosea]
MVAKLYCGEALCKAAVTAPGAKDAPWPIRCASCGTALYPRDVLARLPPNELEPKRGELTTERAGRRVPIDAKDLQAAQPPAAPSDAGDVDRILAMVELDPGGARPARSKAWVWIAVGIAAAGALLAAVLATR